ncbi:CotH kinase family protein [Pseudobacteroides cellulosolvens]|uniref:Spore coat protein CotH n=1 Tax=Pseudobacteroides cellulosolvens ATCC 35603 = DSM 2933 TaxID=398512 RepID=A0A0L6JJW6_9FIRM|nr:CotH kinase family protein [Pseudobacteroides cellulosolvens]KNY25662.1 Spore coat protein CotH [Pseudobacteroides cellulosolvens ATCC 35603 = DSM 2933]
MKVKLPALTVSLTVMVLAISMFGWGYKEKVYASETGSTTIASLNTKYNQLEMPILAINTDSGSQINSDEEYAGAKVSIINDKGNYEITDMTTSVRLRGSSSMYAEKKSYKMKFEEKQNLLGIGDGKGKPWLLIANHSDHSLLRNLTAYRFAEKLTGMSYSPNCRSIELYLNGEYQGVYLLCEDNNVNKNRVAIEESPDEVENNGYLVEMSRYEGENKFDVDTESYVIKSELSETAAIKEQQINYISNYIKESYDALKNGNQENAKKYIDLDSLVDIYIGNEIVKNVDAGWDSFYMYKDINGKLCFGPMWDFDLAMGNANCVKGFDSWVGFSPYTVLNVNANSNPWFCNALTNKWFRELVKERWNELQNDLNDLPNIVISEAESNYKSYCRNFDKWNILGKQTNISPEEIVKLPTYKDHYMYLSNWLSKRVSWLTEHFNNEDFKNGIFVKEDGKELSAKSNLLELSSILAFGNEMTYEILPNTGIAVAVQNGGSESWATQAIASGFMLEKGEEYVLSFDYKCTDERTLPFAVQLNHAPWSPLHSGNLNITSELQHYQAAFTASANDSNCALAFSLGEDTFNGTVVTFDNLSLVKKSATKVLIGDIDGNGAVNMSDVVLMAAVFNSVIGDGDYKASCDLNNDGSINMADAVIIALNFNKTIND